MTAQQTPQVLPDVIAAVINNGIAAQAGLNPGKDPIFQESAESESAYPYVNIIAARAEDKDNEVYQKIVELYHTEEVRKAIDEEFKGGQFMTVLTDEELEKTFEDLKAISK